MAVTGGAVAGQGDAAAEGNDQSFLVQVAGGEIEGVDKEVAGVTQIGEGGGEKAAGSEEGVIIPALDAKVLKRAESIEAGLLQVAVQDGLAGPADLGEMPVGIEEG